VVSIAAKKVTKVIDQGDSAPCGLAANPNGKEVYESYCDLRNSPSISSDLRVLNTSSNTASRRIAIPNLSQGIAFSPNGKYAYVAEGGESGFSVINTSTNKAVKQVPIAASSSVSVLDRVSISSNGQDLYATSGPPPIFGPGAGSLDVIPLSSGVTR
jgi:YVTN family beta-propeller protein